MYESPHAIAPPVQWQGHGLPVASLAYKLHKNQLAVVKVASVGLVVDSKNADQPYEWSTVTRHPAQKYNKVL